jgi:hypothetical protein
MEASKIHLSNSTCFRLSQDKNSNTTMSAEQPMNIPDTLEFLRFMNELKVNFDTDYYELATTSIKCS